MTVPYSYYRLPNHPYIPMVNIATSLQQQQVPATTTVLTSTSTTTVTSTAPTSTSSATSEIGHSASPVLPGSTGMSVPYPFYGLSNYPPIGDPYMALGYSNPYMGSMMFNRLATPPMFPQFSPYQQFGDANNLLPMRSPFLPM